MSVESGVLRNELRERAIEYAQANQIPYYESLGATPTVMFHRFGNTLHGNFHHASYAVASTTYRRRLAKSHPKRNALPEPYRRDACELDSSNSSDALLMNIFCHPNLDRRRLAEVLGVHVVGNPRFGVRHRLRGEVKWRPTELDMVFDRSVAIEAKLTEPDFKSASPSKLERYNDFEAVFDAPALRKLAEPSGDYQDYQLLRNVLAAYELNQRFVLLYDRRRPDLHQRFIRVVGTICFPELRARCSCLTWQDVRAAVPAELQVFLLEKYGIS